MRIIDIISKKKYAKQLSKEEIEFFISNLQEIPDYQIASLLMAIWCKGMNDKETAYLTQAMAKSGEMADLSNIDGIKVDKHSSGGVSDTTTIVIAPIIASLGAKVAKMSGRGLGHSGGTVDKLESIPGYKVNQSLQDFSNIVNSIGCSIIGQTQKVAPADKILYSLRDVTATVDSLPLIASSIMSKKLAAGADKILLDVKWGNGAFMQDKTSALKLATAMVNIGKHSKKETVALITNMNQMLGNAVGNSLEIKEGIEILKGDLKGDLTDLCIALSSHCLVLSEKYNSYERAEEDVKKVISNGKALEKFAQMIQAHSGDPRICENTDLLPKARYEVTQKAKSSGYISKIHTNEVGMCSVLIGAGRLKKEDEIDYSAGLIMHKRLADEVKKGDLLCTWYVNDLSKLKEVQQKLENAIIISEERVKKEKLIYKVVS